MRKGKYENPSGMPRRNKSAIVGLVCLLLVLVLAVGGTAAYFFRISAPVTNTFTGGSVGCKLQETVTGNTKESITVTNDGTFPVYMRIRLVSYWADSNGLPVAKTAPALNVTTASGWTQIGDCYYYTKPVQSGETVSFLASPLTMVSEDGYTQVMEVLAESIQSSPADAVTQMWGRTVDASGNITG